MLKIKSVPLAYLAERFCFSVARRDVLERPDDGVRLVVPIRNDREGDPTQHELVGTAESGIEWSTRPFPDGGVTGVFATCRVALVKAVFQ